MGHRPGLALRFALFVALLACTAVQAGLRVRGTVGTQDGSDPAGARVVLRPVLSAHRAAAARLDGRYDAEPVARTEVAPGGGFEIEAPEAGMWAFEVAAAGFVPMRLELLPLLEETALAEVVLRPAETIEVRVVGPGGNSVSGAQVSARSTSFRFWAGGGFFGRSAFGWQPAPRRGHTDENGTLSLLRAAGEELTLRAAAAGRVESAEVETREGSVRLALGAGREVALRARARGAAVADVIVRVGAELTPLARTDENGLASLAVAEDDTVRVVLTDREGRRFDGAVEGRAASGRLDLELVEPRRLTGRVLDADTRRPLARAVVWESDDPAGAVSTDGGGSFELPIASGRELVVGTAFAGYFPDRSRLSDTTPHEPVFALRPAARVSGRVVDGDGAPVAGARVAAREAQAGGRMMIRFGAKPSAGDTLTDEGGRFVLGGLEPGKSYTLTARRPGFAPGEAELTDLEPLATRPDVRIELGSGVSIVGRVADAGDAPIAGARIELAPGGGRSMRMMRAFGGGPESDEPETYTGNDGRFAIHHLKPGGFDLDASAAGFAPATLPGVEAVVAAGEVDVGTITLAPGVAIEGRVTDSDGRPIEAAEVWAEEPNPMSRLRARFSGGDGDPDATSAPDGFFRVADRRPGEKVDLAVRRKGYAAASVAGVEVPPTTPVVVELQPASTLSGRVLDPGGKPVPQARIQAYVEGGGATGGGAVFMMAMAGAAVSDAEGAFTLEDLEPGTVRLSVSATGFRETERSNIEIPAGENVEGFEIELLTGASVTGRVLASDGSPVVGARVAVVEAQRRMGPRRSGGTESDGDGQYYLEGVEPGTRLIGADSEELGNVTREIEVDAGANRLDLTFEGGVEVAGGVVDEAGGPIAGADVFLSSSTRFFRGGPEQRTSADGSFSFTGVRDGTYRLSAVRDGFAQVAEAEPVEVAAAPLYGLEVRLAPGAAIVGRIYGLEPERLGELDVFARSSSRRWAMGEVRHDGTYRVDDLGAGDWRVEATLANGSGRAEGRVTLEPGQSEAVLDLELGSGLQVTGRVLRGVDALPGVSVSLAGIDVSSRASSTTDRGGRFSLQGVEPGRHRLTVMDFSTGLHHQEEHEIRADRDLVVEIRASRISGHVVDSSDSSPVAGAVVRLEALEERDEMSGVFGRGGKTDAAGRFSVHDVAAGSYRLVAEKDGYTPGNLNLRIEPDRFLDDLEVALQPTDGLSLRVFLPSGSPARSVSVSVQDAAGQGVVGGDYAVDQDGRVRLATLPAGTWRLLVATNGTAVADFTATAPGSAGDVRLEPEARLEVAIPELAEDRAIVRVEAIGDDGRPALTFTWAGQVRGFWRSTFGRATLDGLSPGAWRIRATAPDGRLWEKRVTLGVGTNPPLVLD